MTGLRKVFALDESGKKTPFTWMPLTIAGTDQKSALIVDDKGHRMALNVNHTIFDDGVVNPSVGHLVDGCGFHEWITLEGWKPGSVIH